MIGYATIGTNDLPRATAFYDALLGEIKARRVAPNDRLMMWSVAPNTPMLGVIKPFDGQAAAPGNGNMVALVMKSREQVDALHKKALELGASDEGAPGARSATFYGAYFRDLDGNKLAFFCMG